MARLLQAQQATTCSSPHNETLGRQQVEARGDLERREKAVAEMVRPLTESLTRVDARLERLDRDRVQTASALQQQLRTMVESPGPLRGETGALVAALRKPQTRGRWGELQLRSVVELAGMIALLRLQRAGDGARRRRRAAARPGRAAARRQAASWSTPRRRCTRSWTRYEATDEAARDGHLAAHARLLREHVAQLAAKSYWSQFDDAPDFVLLFLPGEHFLTAALEADPGADRAGRRAAGADRHADHADRAAARGRTTAGSRRRWPRTPARSATLGRELYSRLGTLAEHLRQLGRAADAERWTPTTRRSARWRRGCWSAPAGSASTGPSALGRDPRARADRQAGARRCRRRS